MRFADFYVGQVLEAGPYQITRQDIVEFATRWDPQWFHIDPQAAVHGPFGGLIASGMQTLAIAMHLVVPLALAGSESLASPGLSYVRWPHPLRAGDAVRLRLTVREVRRSQSRPELGIVRWRWQLRNQNEVEVLDTEATSMFALRPSPA